MSSSVLVVDDHPAITGGAKDRFEAAGWTVRTASSPEAALDILVQRVPDVALLDIEFRTSVLTGFDLLREIARRHPAVRSVMYSMHDDGALVEAARRNGARAFVPKDRGWELVIRVAKRVVAGRTLFPRPRPDPGPLTGQQLKVVRCLARGIPEKQIAAEMAVTERTIVFHVESAKRKTGAKSIGELVAIATQRSWLLLPHGRQWAGPAPGPLTPT